MDFKLPSNPLEVAKEAEEEYCWIKPLFSNVYNNPSGQKKKVVAHLLVGSWVKKLGPPVGTKNPEVNIEFNGGKGWIADKELCNERLLHIYFLDVRQGDSILVETPESKRILIDGGKNGSALSFLRWKYHLDSYKKDFEAIILTHGDQDHSEGLIKILKHPSVIVKRIYHNGIAKRTDGLGKIESKPEGDMLVDLYDDIDDLDPVYNQLTNLYKRWVDSVKTARRRAKKHKVNLEVKRADQNLGKIKIDKANGLEIEFLNPINLGSPASPKLMSFGDEGITINGNSVSVVLKYKKAKILLCGDLNRPAEKLLLDNTRKKSLKSHVFKANHHGSEDFTPDFLKAATPWISVVSSGDQPDYGHPRANLLGSLGHYSPRKIAKPLVFSTELSATFRKIPESERTKKDVPHLYEKINLGIIHVRTNGRWIAAGRTYDREKVKTAPSSFRFKWEAYAFNLRNARALKNDFSEIPQKKVTV